MTTPTQSIESTHAKSTEGAVGRFYPLILAALGVGLVEDSTWAKGVGLAGHPVLVFLVLLGVLYAYWFWMLRELRRRRQHLSQDSPAEFERWRKRKERRGLFIGVPIGVVAGVLVAHFHVPGGLAFGLFMFLLVQGHLARGEHMHRVESLELETRRQALQSRLAPHFIFNTLNTLHAQIEVDPREAQATTERLAGLFRQVIAVADRPTTPLREELAFVEAYLGIEKARLGDRLKVRIDVPEELEACPIPPLSLQVLVENAVKHGVGAVEEGGEVRISALRVGNRLTLGVEDPGQGQGVESGTGTALETLRMRLEKPSDLEMRELGNRHRVSFQWRVA